MQIRPYVFKIGRSIAKGLRQMGNSKLKADTRLYAEKGKLGTYAYERAQVTASQSGKKIIFTLEVNGRNGREKLQSSNPKEVVSEMKLFAPMANWKPLE